MAEAPQRQATKQIDGKESFSKVTEEMSGLLRLMSGYFKNVAKLQNPPFLAGFALGTGAKQGEASFTP